LYFLILSKQSFYFLSGTKLHLTVSQKASLTKRKAVTFGKVCIFTPMKTAENETLPTKEECDGSLRNILDALYVLNGKWKIPLILCLVQSPKRFNEIQNTLTGISPKVLSKELKDLELNDFIKRNVYPTTPVSIVYEATDYSSTLKSVITELSIWGELHREKVKESMRK
jgi:DNA-binding HxlR family transcriptional regulator